ncbi:MAG: aminodeoxychorismate/anthranilate synthase component II [Chlorobiota bacterium]|nr:aminodeoxychorismate/anthranilate synthase component II [Chlorobiota bacterium]QQS67165.1 MAG: aminodeoxychorismate/anthranilate synthase component II [Chlorobiota bacterium]
MRILIVDNYDSFTYNLFQLLEQAKDGNEIVVIKSDKILIDEVKSFDKIVFSPGAGLPREYPIMYEIIDRFYKTKPILGVCLGHQAIAESFGASLMNIGTVRHGKQMKAFIKANDYLFEGIDSEIDTGLYHSFAVSNNGFPDILEITSITSNGTIMSFKHREFDIRGIQFHPESILTPLGIIIIKNWLNKTNLYSVN